jgi:hypothetical protein
VRPVLNSEICQASDRQQQSPPRQRVCGSARVHLPPRPSEAPPCCNGASRCRVGPDLLESVRKHQ